MTGHGGEVQSLVLYSGRLMASEEVVQVVHVFILVLCCIVKCEGH